MKKLAILSLSIFSFTLFGFSEAPNEVKEENIPCRVTCVRTVGDVQYVTSAGNFLSSCERAARRCQEKLDQIQGEE